MTRAHDVETFRNLLTAATVHSGHIGNSSFWP
jgi:hypothetical protein